MKNKLFPQIFSDEAGEAEAKATEAMEAKDDAEISGDSDVVTFTEKTF